MPTESNNVSVVSDNSYLASDMTVNVYVIIYQDESFVSGDVSTNPGMGENVTQ